MVNTGSEASAANSSRANVITIVIIVIVVLAIVLNSLIDVLLMRAIKNPIVELSRVAKCIAVGDIDIKIDYQSKDEIGDLGRAFQEVADAIKAQANVLETISTGDYTVSITVRSDQDVMNKAINTMVDSNK